MKETSPESKKKNLKNIIELVIALVIILLSLPHIISYVDGLQNEDSSHYSYYDYEATLESVTEDFETDYIPQTHCLTACFVNHSPVFFYDGKPVEADVISGEMQYLYTNSKGYSQHIQHNLDGSVSYFLIDDTLYICIDGQIIKLQSGVLWHALSSSGKAIVYTTEGTLHRFDTASRATEIIASNCTISSLCVSGNGEYILYSTVSSLKLWHNGETTKLADSQYDAVNVSDNGQHIYASNNCLYRFNPSGQYETISMGYGYFNADGSQLLFYSDDGTYISIDGNAPHKIYNEYVQPVLPSGYQMIGNVYPAASLLNKAYRLNYSYPVFFLTSTCATRAIPDSPFAATLDSTGRYLYHFDYYGLKCYDLHAESVTSFNAQDLYDEFLLTSPDNRYVYVTSGNILYRLDSQQISNSCIITMTFGWNDESVFADANGHVYYSDVDGLHYFDGTTSIRLDGIEWVQGDVIGNIYACTISGEIFPIVNGELIVNN